MQKTLKPWCMGTHLRVLDKSYLLNTSMTGIRWFSKIFASLCSIRGVRNQNRCSNIKGVHTLRSSYQTGLETTFKIVVQGQEVCTLGVRYKIEPKTAFKISAEI